MTDYKIIKTAEEADADYDQMLKEHELEKKPISPWYYYIHGDLIKAMKPCKIGDRIHLHCWQGLYTVEYVNCVKFVVRKGGLRQELGWHEFRCLSGQGESFEKKIKLIGRALKTCKANEVSAYADALIDLAKGHFNP